VRFLAEPRRIAWIAVSAVAGLIAGQLVVCPGEFWRGIFVLGFVPGILQGFVLWRSQLFRMVSWLALTQFGVVTTFVFSAAAVVFMFWLVSAVVPVSEPSDRTAPSLVGWLAFLSGSLIGGAGLGGLQVTGFPRQQRRARWVLATMLGCIAVAPIAIAVTGIGSCQGPLGLPNQLVGIIGGSLYGLVTALALPPRSES
jgi:MFS family permease